MSESENRFCVSLLRERFFKKIQDWILKSERIRKRILRIFTKQINPRSLGLWCIKGTEESTLGVDSWVTLRHRDPKDLGLICLEKTRKIHFRILSDLRIQSWIFLKKRTLNRLVQDLLDHGPSKEPKNPLSERILRFL